MQRYGGDFFVLSCLPDSMPDTRATAAKEETDVAVSVADVLAAQARLRRFLPPTPLHYAERFVVKYATELATTPPEEITGQRPGRVALFPDHHALLRAWQPEVMLRATQAMRRSL